MRTMREVFDAWAPPGGRWSPWVKPVVFAHMTPALTAFRIGEKPAGDTGVDLAWLPPPGQAFIIADLPGAAGVRAGLALAGHGYRPVPVYNAAPGEDELVNVTAVLQALWDAADALAALPLPPDAPPAFLIDWPRRTGEGFPDPECFDNRSIVFPSDFPSANLLLSRGLNRAIVWQAYGHFPQDDLAHALRRWQDAGVEILVKPQGEPVEPRAAHIERPTMFRGLLYRFLECLHLRRNTLGGFGAEIPESSSG